MIYTAYSAISGQALAGGANTASTRANAMRNHEINDAYIVVLAFERAIPGRWQHTTYSLDEARKHGSVVFRGDGYSPRIPAIAIQE